MFHLWLDEKRVVDFLLVLIEFFSLDLMVAALLNEICRNQRILKGWVWVTLSANIWWMGTSTTIHLWTVR